MPTPIADPDSADWVLGPASVTWRVMLTPWVPLIAGLRTLMIESLHPLAMRGVADHSDYLRRPVNRLQHTADYVAATAMGTVQEANAAGRKVRGIHARVRGHDPTTGRDYSADDPATQVWVHFVQWYSYLAVHRMLVGGLSAEEEDRFVAEGVPIATYVGTPAAMVPTSVAEARDYFASVRSQLCMTDAAREGIDFLTGRRIPRNRSQLALFPTTRVIGTLATATIPQDLRRLMGLNQSRVMDAAARNAVRMALPVLATPPSRAVYRQVIGSVSAAYMDRGLRIMRERRASHMPR